MLVDIHVDSVKKRQAQPKLKELVSNKKKLINTVKLSRQQAKTPTTQRMMETGAAIAAQGASMLQTISRKKWSKNMDVEFGVSRNVSPSRSRSRSRHHDLAYDEDSHAT